MSRTTFSKTAGNAPDSPPTPVAPLTMAARREIKGIHPDAFFFVPPHLTTGSA
jgi:hypothetical protein